MSATAAATSTATSTAVTLPPRPYPKRKRAQISYAEPVNSDDSTFYDSDAAGEGVASRKKAKPSNRPLPRRKIFPFFRLPRELRDMIYSHALVDPNRIYLTEKTRSYRRGATRADFSVSYSTRSGLCESVPAPRLAPQLCAVSKQLHAEAMPVLYGQPFVVEDSVAMHFWLAGMSRETRSLLRDIKLEQWCFSRGRRSFIYGVFAILAEGGLNLKRLDFSCTRLLADPMWVARRLYRAAFRWMEAVGAARGRKDAAVDLLLVYPEEFGYSGEEDEDAAALRTELRKLLTAS